MSQSAPAVDYPVGRFLWGAWLALVFSLTTALALTLSFWIGLIEGWRFTLLCAVWCLLTLYSAATFKQTSSKAWLCWDGQAWELQFLLEPPSQLAHSISVHLDFQKYFLVSLSGPNVSRQWFWVSKLAFPERWHGFRCAVYSRSE